MNYTTVYVGMDVHKETFTLCCYTNEKEKAEYPQKVNGHYSKVLNYINAMRKHYGDDAVFVCGYEAGCLGFTLYHQLTEHNVDCVILAPTTMPQPQGKKKVKTDKRDAMLIARCLAHKDYSPVHIPTDIDEQVKEYVRMRDDHKLALKKVKQQIIAFCLRHDYRYTEGKSNWTEKHLQWLRSLESNGVYAEILEEYLPEQRVLDLTGCSLESVLYYLNRDIPVLAVADDQSALLLVGFNDLNTVWMNPKTGKVYKVGMNDSRKFFEENGNRFITYIEK